MIILNVAPSIVRGSPPLRMKSEQHSLSSHARTQQPLKVDASRLVGKDVVHDWFLSSITMRNAVRKRTMNCDQALLWVDELQLWSTKPLKFFLKIASPLEL